MTSLPAILVAALSFSGATVFAEAASRVMRISVENSGTHVQVRMLKRFSQRAAEASGGSLVVELYDGARLFRDADVVSALSLGKVEMAVPGIWQLDRYAPDFASLMLPSVYGRTEVDIARVVDTEFGVFLSGILERTLTIVVLGRWMELGSAHTFFIGKSVRELRGLRVRVPGGEANEERIRALGSFAVAIPWPDLPSILSRGLVDAVVTTYETILSANLHTFGIGAVLEESHYVGYYVPMINRRFWESLDDRTRSAVKNAWDATVEESRIESRTAQANAKKNLLEHGVRLRASSSSESAVNREKLMLNERSIAERIHVSDEALDRLHAAFGVRIK